MTVSQTQFRDAVLNAQQPVPEGLCDATGGPAGTRFSVYRNNVVVSLSEALATAFPLLRKLVGTDTFARLAGVYVRAHPPKSPLMMFYGEDMPGFLAAFEPLKHIGYLADAARLDLAQRHAYHAADAETFDPSPLQAGDEASAQMRIMLAPATQIIRSAWPLYDIWRFNFEADAPKPRATAQDVLVTRPGFDPLVHLLPIGGADWLDRFRGGEAFGTATSAVAARHPQFDLTATLTLALTSGALANNTAKEAP